MPAHKIPFLSLKRRTSDDPRFNPLTPEETGRFADAVFDQIPMLAGVCWALGETADAMARISPADRRAILSLIETRLRDSPPGESNGVDRATAPYLPLAWQTMKAFIQNADRRGAEFSLSTETIRALLPVTLPTDPKSGSASETETSKE